MGAAQRMAAVLGHPRWPWVAAALGVLLALPALTTGWVLDDHLHRVVIELHVQGQAEGVGAWWDLYSAAEGDPALTRARMEQGFAPWWTAPDLRVRFFRPVSAATHYVDRALWPDSPGLMHAHSLAWAMALVVGVGRLLRRWLAAGWVAGIAVLVFALDDAHAVPLAWIAGRNALVGGVLVVATLCVHDRARRDGWRPGLWLGPLLLALALLAHEGSVAALGYLLAHALLLGPHDRPWWTRVLRSWGPYLAVVVLWRLLYDALGYGAAGSGVYLDPVAEPRVFAAALPERVADLGLRQLGWPGIGDGAPAPGWVLVPVVGLLLVLGPRLRRDRGLAVCLVGAVLALVPAAAVVPSDRGLVLCGVGASAVVAGVAAVAVDRTGGWVWLRMLAAGLALALGVVHLGLAPAARLQRTGQLGADLERPQHDVVKTLPADSALADQELVIVNSPPTFFISYLWLMRWNTDQALPQRLRVLGSTFGPVVVRRPDDRTLDLLPVGGYFGDPFTALARGRARPFAAGDRVSLAGWTVEIQTVTEGRPTAVRVAFDRPLHDPGFRWVTWQGDGFVPWELPAVGGSAALPGLR